MKKITIIVTILLSLVFVVVSQDATTNNRDAALQALAQVNAWRIEQDLLPLAINPTLEKLAIAQATYVEPRLDNINDESQYHLDANNRNPRERAYVAGWATYGRPDRIEVGENAAVGSVTYAVGFWKSSSIHARAALNPTYREVGVAAIPSQFGYMFIMFFGSRPNVYPVSISSDGEELYITNERSSYATVSNLQIRLFDENGTAISATQAWQSQLTIPRNADNHLSILFTNGDQQSITTVNLMTDYVVLPDTLELLEALASGITTTDTNVGVALSSTTTNTTSSQNSVANVPTNTPAPTNTPVPTNTPTPAPARALTILASSNSLILYNGSGVALNISGLSIGNSERQIGLGAWQSLAPVNESAFAATDCLQINISGQASDSDSRCRFVRSSIQMSSSRAFWLTGEYTVSINGQVIATCQPEETTCDVNLP
jgi:hypothetical protein